MTPTTAGPTLPNDNERHGSIGRRSGKGRDGQRSSGGDHPALGAPHSSVLKGANSMGFIAWIVVGAIAGFLANQLMGSREGLVMMVVLGIVGGLVGGFVATSVLKIGTVDGINIESIVIATLGAIAVIFVYRAMSRSRGTSATG